MPPRSILLALFFSSSFAFAQRGVALTYVMPPGGEGAASVALGVALPGGLPSMEINPALLAWEGARTSSMIQYASSQSDLLPELHIPGLKEEVRSLGLRFPIKSGTDVALGYSWHHLELGTTNYSFDDIHHQVLKSDETVQHLVLAGRLAGIASIGVGWKWLDSRLAPGVVLDSAGTTMRGTAEASTWDLGILVAPRWRIPKTPLRIGPSLGMSLINVAQDSVDYGNPVYKDPVNRMRRWGGAAVLNSPDLLNVELFLDEQVELSDSSESSAYNYQGWTLDVLGIVRWASADLLDRSGKRTETQESVQYTFDLKQLYRLGWRWKTWDWSSQIDTPEGYPLPSWKFRGAKMSPNVRFTWTRAKIRGWDHYGAGSSRNGQSRFAWAVSL